MKKLFLFFFIAFNLNAGTHIVTSNADDGEGSLRKIVADANANDTIIFASNINQVTLTTGHIRINKSITIIGKENEKTIISGNNNSKIFMYYDSNVVFNIRNLILENGYSTYRAGAVDMYNDNYSINNAVLIAIDCVFKNNNGQGGAITVFYANNIAIVTNCLFDKNKSIEGAGGAAGIVGGNFIAISCSFNKNEPNSSISAFHNANLILINNTFERNSAVYYGGAVSLINNVNAYLYHNTFDMNQADSGGAILHSLLLPYPPYYSLCTLYTYNSIYTANEEKGVISEAGQIRGKISGGKNLIENGTTITRDSVFGNNEYKDGFIMPTAFAKKAERLTTMDIANPVGIMTDDSIINLLITDQINYKRPDTGFVTYGAIEYDSTYGIKADGSFDILVLPNPTDRDFNIIFDNPREQKITIDLVDIEGKIVLNIFDGVASAGWQVYRVKDKLASSVYFVKFAIKDNIFIRKVVVK